MRTRGDRWQEPSQARETPPPSSQTLTRLFGCDVDGGTGGAGASRVVRSDCQVIQRVASQVGDFRRRLIAHRSNPFRVLFLFVVSPTPDLRSRAGTCLPPATGRQRPALSSADCPTQKCRRDRSCALSQPLLVPCSEPARLQRSLPGTSGAAGPWKHILAGSPQRALLCTFSQIMRRKMDNPFLCERNPHVLERRGSKHAAGAQLPPGQAGAAPQ